MEQNREQRVREALDRALGQVGPKESGNAAIVVVTKACRGLLVDADNRAPVITALREWLASEDDWLSVIARFVIARLELRELREEFAAYVVDFIQQYPEQTTEPIGDEFRRLLTDLKNLS